jgi:hypothetical protein
MNALPIAGANEGDASAETKAAIVGLVGIEPKDELEGMIAAQLIAGHNAAMECYRRAMLPGQAFEFRRENLNQAGKLSRTFATLLEDLDIRGLLDSTLVIAMGEFGRTPWVNPARGRDHYPNAWSLMLAGCGIKRGVVVGATDVDGVEVAEKPFNEKNLFATIFSALGIDPYAEYDLPGLPTFHRVEEKAEPIREVLS